VVWAELAGVGLGVGFLVGLSGVGGGSIMTPVLILVIGMNPLVAVGTDLLYSVPMKVLAALLHAKQQTVDLVLVRALLIGGIPGSMVGIALLFELRHTLNIAVLTIIVKHGIAIALLLCATVLMVGLLWRKAEAAEATGRPIKSNAAVVVGAIVGLIVAFTSIGSGALTLPLLMLIAPTIGMRRLVGTDIVFGALLIPVAAAGQVTLGNVNIAVAAALAVGALPGIVLGSKLCGRLPDSWLRSAVAAVFLVAAIRLV
jgi:uncharacterized protein